MDKQKKQHKPIVCRKHTIIERERLLAHEDIINDTQYSGKEEGTQIVAYWKDEETGETLVSDAYSKGKLRGSGWYFPTALKQPEVPIYDWTPNYTGTGYVSIPDWNGVAGDVVELTASWDSAHHSNNYIFDGYNNRLYINSQYETAWQVSGNADFYVNGELVEGLLHPLPPKGSDFTLITNVKANATISFIGTRISINDRQWQGSIKNIKLTKADGSDSRFYDSVIKSETEPETLVLEDSISGKHGTLRGFPENAVWKDITPTEIDGEQ